MGKRKEPEHWTVGKWKDIAQYCCKYCPFDSLSAAAIQDHYDKNHKPVPLPQPKVFIPIADRYGNQINQEVREDAENDAD